MVKGKFLKIDSFELTAGRMIGRKYRILSQLGSGWEGEVYKVLESATGIERAAKLFYPQRNLHDKASKLYAKRLHNLQNCSLLIQYHTQEILIVRRTPITVLISEYVEGVLLSEFLKVFPGNRMDPFKALHLLYALIKGIEEIHSAKDYHGDLHTDNIIVNRFGLEFDLKVVDLYHLSASKHENRREDLCGLIQVFHEVLGGAKYYSKHPAFVKEICCGLKRSLILKKFRTVTQLRQHLENLEWTGNKS